MAASKNEWFVQQDRERRGCMLSFRVEELLYSTESPYHKIEVFRTEPFGLVLAVDDAVQCAEKNDFIFQEMAVHSLAFSHESPSRALLVGCNNIHFVTHLLYHRGLERIDICEPDEAITDALRRFVPVAGKDLLDPRVEVFREEPLTFLRSHVGCYDLIYDCSSESPRRNMAYLRALNRALLPHGNVLLKVKPYFLAAEKVCVLAQNLGGIFPFVGYAQCPSPVRPVGEGAFFSASKSNDVTRPVRYPMRSMRRHMKAYSRDYHKAIFKHPVYWERLINDQEENFPDNEERIK